MDLAADVKEALSDSSGHFSVDTDVEDGVECAPPVAAKKVAGLGSDDSQSFSGSDASAQEGALDDEGGDDPSAAVDAGDGAIGAGDKFRHPAVTWKIWESLWFYITRTPGWMDVKIHMKSALRNVSTGMGLYNFTRTLSPHHYGETFENPKRTLLLLRAWAIYRARHGGWARQREGRLREVALMKERLLADIRSEGCFSPMLGTAAAERWLVKWVPDVVTELRPEG